MSPQFAPFFFLQSVALGILLFGLFVSTKPPERTVPFYLLFTSILLFFAASLVRAFVFLFDTDSQLISNNRQNLSFENRLEGIAIFVLFLAIFIKPLFFRAFVRPISIGLFLSTILIWLVISVWLIATFSGLNSTQSLKSSVISIFLYLWILIEIRAARNASNFLMTGIYYLVSLLLLIHLIFAMIFLWLSLISPPSEYSFLTFQQFDLLLRYLRISMLLCFDVMCVFYWVQNYSTEAIRSIENRKKIDELLIEKDLLIQNLINTNALVHTGALSAGIAHEINQFLARIQLDVDTAKLYLAEKTDRTKISAVLDRVLDANQSAATLILNLKRLFITRDEIIEKCDLNHIAESIVDLFLDQANQMNIEIEKKFKAHSPVFIQESLIRQVIANLVRNAIDALNSVDRQNKKIIIETLIEGGDWVLRIEDNAHGITAENIPNIFSLFATNKTHGTGVGLWLSHFIIEQHGGDIKFQNCSPQGVVFIVQVPLSFSKTDKTVGSLLGAG
jgi:signal transduction histidine kinase